MNKKLIIIIRRPLTKNEYLGNGIDYLKKKFKTQILDISKLTDEKFTDFKKGLYYESIIVKSLDQFDRIIKKYKNSFCLDIANDYKSILVRKKLKENNILIISPNALSSYPYKLKQKKFNEKIFNALKILLLHPVIFFRKFIISIGYRLTQKFENIDIAVLGGLKSMDFSGFKKAKYKVYASSIDYGIYLKKNKLNKILKNKNFAVFIDTYLPFHPENNFDTNLFINPKEYYDSLVKFFNIFKAKTKLDVVIALYPKADLRKYPQSFKRFKMYKDKTTDLIRASKLVLHHGSTAQSYAVIYKKPTIFLTSNQMVKLEYLYDHTFRRYLLESKQINVDQIDYEFISNRKKLFCYNKKIYRNYSKNYLKHPNSANKPWYEVLNKYIEKNF